MVLHACTPSPFSGYIQGCKHRGVLAPANIFPGPPWDRAFQPAHALGFFNLSRLDGNTLEICEVGAALPHPSSHVIMAKALSRTDASTNVAKASARLHASNALFAWTWPALALSCNHESATESLRSFPSPRRVHAPMAAVLSECRRSCNHSPRPAHKDWSTMSMHPPLLRHVSSASMELSATTDWVEDHALMT